MRGERNFHWSRTALLSRRAGDGESSYKSQGCAICAAVSNVPGLPARFPLLSFATSLLLPILFQDIVEALYLLFAIFQRQRLRRFLRRRLVILSVKDVCRHLL